MILKELQRYTGRRVNMIYPDRHNKLTQRRVMIHSVDNVMFRAYCFDRRAPRVFAVNRVLAVFPYTEAAAQL